MRKALFTLILLMGSLCLFGQDQRRIVFHVIGAENQWLFLANYYGNKLFYTDSTMADASGTATFQRASGYRTGVYALLRGNAYVTFLVNEPELELATAAGDLRGQFIVKRSTENQFYLDYMRFLNIQGNVKNDLERKRLNTTDPAAIKTFEKEAARVDQSIAGYQRDFVAQHKGTLVAVMVGLEMAPEEKMFIGRDGGMDSAATAFHRRTHYWDNTELRNSDLVRIPAFQNKLDEYFSLAVAHEPDSINAAADELLVRVSKSDELFKLILSRLTDRYNDPEVLGNDAVFVHLAQAYYCPANGGTGRAAWKTKDELRSLCERARKEAPLVLGAKAQELILPDTTGRKWIKLSEVPDEWTLVIFWSPHCSHCVSALPEIHKQYKEKLQPLGLQVYAVAEASDSLLTADWKAFVHNHQLDWINVGLSSDVLKDIKKNRGKYVPGITTEESLNYQNSWNALNTPTFYLLDKEKRVAGKRMTPDQIIELINKRKAKEDRKR
ncbi:MAG: redoxin domain-containing protein [Flavobacteriales bacterium]